MRIFEIKNEGMQKLFARALEKFITRHVAQDDTDPNTEKCRTALINRVIKRFNVIPVTSNAGPIGVTALYSLCDYEIEVSNFRHAISQVTDGSDSGGDRIFFDVHVFSKSVHAMTDDEIRNKLWRQIDNVVIGISFETATTMWPDSRAECLSDKFLLSAVSTIADSNKLSTDYLNIETRELTTVE